MKFKLTAAEHAALPDDATRALYKPAADGAYTLKLDDVDPAALMAKVDEFRTTNTVVMKERDALIAKFGDLDPAAARAAMNELDTLKKQAGVTKADDVTEAIRAAVTQAVAPLQETVSKLTADKTAAEQAAAAARFDSAFDSVALDSGVRRGSLRDVRARAKDAGFALASDGRIVQQRAGVPVYEGGVEVDAGRWLTATLKREADWFFEPNAGAGAPGSTPTSTASKVLTNPDPMEFGRNLADIASGKTEVRSDALATQS